MKKNDVLAEKSAKLNKLIKASNGAVSMITNTVSNLESVNQSISETIREIDEYKAELTKTAESLDPQYATNDKIVAKFKAFLED